MPAAERRAALVPVAGRSAHCVAAAPWALCTVGQGGVAQRRVGLGPVEANWDAVAKGISQQRHY